MKSLYIHIPFCRQKCFYCSFVVCVSHQKRRDLYVDCLIGEMKQHKNKQIDSIYLGGGTPSVLSCAQLKKLFDAIYSTFRVSKKAEITLEANPEDVSVEAAAHFVAMGVNRFSLGVQSLNDPCLKSLGRGHDARTAKHAYDVLRQKGAENISVDLISMLPGQTMRELMMDIRKIISWKPEHISLYALTIEKNSRMYALNSKLPSEQKQRTLFLAVKKACEEAGFHHYEVSNFARSGFESRHNMNYWQGGDYIGIGMAAHSHIKGRRYWNVSRLMDYVNGITQGQSVIEEEEKLSNKQRLMEAICFGLRMTEGVDLSFLQKKFGVSLDVDRVDLIQALMDEGYLFQEKKKIKVTCDGMLVLDEISSRLI
ncbi:radical SAM family heme chaperone HemW [Candidatus Omnitrophota bacterium]